MLDYDIGDEINELQFEIKQFIRDIVRFENASDLYDRIAQDVNAVRQDLSKN